MMNRTLILLAALCSLATSTLAKGLLSEEQAHAKAVAILKGDPYGKTFVEVSRHIRAATKKPDADAECGKKSGPVWVFDINVPADDIPQEMQQTDPITGPLVLDARSGKMVCAGLPFLR